MARPLRIEYPEPLGTGVSPTGRCPNGSGRNDSSQVTGVRS